MMEEDRMFCTKCGAEIDNDAVFCPYCGAPVEQKGAGSDKLVNGTTGNSEGKKLKQLIIVA